MMNPAVKVKVMGNEKDIEEVRKAAQGIADSAVNIGWKGYITETTLLGQLLTQCGAEFKYIKS